MLQAGSWSLSPYCSVSNPNGSTQRYAYQVGPGGHVLGLTTANGTIAARYFYDPWGRVLSVAGANPALAERQPLRYRGYYYDTETAMYYLPERYYDPVLARFISQDAIQPDLADPIALNLYAYCLNDPVNMFDPSGEWPAWVKSVASAARTAWGHVRAGFRWVGTQVRRMVAWVQDRWRNRGRGSTADTSKSDGAASAGSSGGGRRSSPGVGTGARGQSSADAAAEAERQRFERMVAASETSNAVAEGAIAEATSRFGARNLEIRPSWSTTTGNSAAAIELGGKIVGLIPGVHVVTGAGIAMNNVPGWYSGDKTLGDIVWNASAVTPGSYPASAAMTVHDLAAFVARDGFRVDNYRGYYAWP